MILLTKKTKLFNKCIIIEQIIENKYPSGKIAYFHNIEFKQGKEIIANGEYPISEQTALKIIKENK